MLRLWLIATYLCGSTAIACAVGTTSPTPTGRWLTADHTAVIQIAPCGANLCGQIVGIKLAHVGDPMPVDWRGQPQCGETILQTAPVTDSAADVTGWAGTLLDPRDGDVYRATIALDNNRYLRLRGYFILPIFGQTQIWVPYSGRTLAGCKLAPGLPKNLG